MSAPRKPVPGMQAPPSSMRQVLQHEMPEKPLPFAEQQRILREQQTELLKKYRTRNLALAGAILGFTAATYWYTLRVTKQENLDELIIDQLQEEKK